MMTWRQIDRLRVSHIRKAQKVFGLVFRGIRLDLSKALQNVDSVTEIETVVSNFAFDEDIIWKAWYKVYEDTGLVFAEKNYMHLRGGLKKKDINDAIRRSVWQRKLMEYVDNECGELIQATTKAMFMGIRKNAQKAIFMGVDQGWGAQRITTQIIKFQGEMDNFRAQRIARTEVMRASNEGAMEGVENLGIALKKVWISTNDGREREDHAQVDPVDYNAKFKVGGEELDYPGDPDASPEQTINCRCAVAFEPKESILI
jgi:hypothetical protein